MEINELNAVVRRSTGKGPARRLRKAGHMPAVFYGRGVEAVPLAVSAAELMNLRKREEQAFIKLIITDEGGKQEKLSILKELQIEPLSRRYVHADFYEITMDHKFTFDVPVHFSGQPKGVESGGELHLLKRELKISCFPGMRPDAINVDISGLQIGDSLKVQDLPPVEGVTTLDHKDTVLVTVSAVREAAQPAKEAEGEAAPTETPAK